MDDNEEIVTLGLGGRSDEVDEAGDKEAELIDVRLLAPIGSSGRALLGGGPRLLATAR